MKVYNVICPRCGYDFQVKKGVTVQECSSGKRPPKSRDEEEPDYCPKCDYRVSVEDDDFPKHVRTIMFVD